MASFSVHSGLFCFTETGLGGNASKWARDVLFRNVMHIIAPLKGISKKRCIRYILCTLWYVTMLRDSGHLFSSWQLLHLLLLITNLPVP